MQNVVQSVHSNFIYNSQWLETTQISIKGKWRNGIESYNRKKILRYIVAICVNQKHHIAWEKPEIKENMCCYSIYMKFKAGKINYSNKNQNSGCLSVSGVGRLGRVARSHRRKGDPMAQGNFLCEGNILYLVREGGNGFINLPKLVRLYTLKICTFHCE